MKIIVFIFCALGSTAFAGTWTCATGLDGKQIYQVILQGDEHGAMQSPALVSVAGVSAGKMHVYPDQAAGDELVRLVIGANVPQSASRLRIMAQPLSPNVYRAYSLLKNFPIKKEFEGTCAFAP